MRRASRSPLPWLAGLLALYLLWPVAAIAGHLDAQSLRGLRAGPVLSALGVSAAAATVSAGLIALAGIPLGYVLAHTRSRWMRLVGVLVQLPIALPPLVSGILLLFVVGPYTFLGRLTGGTLTDSFWGIVLAQTFVASPFLVVAARSSFAALDPSLEGVAATLGHRTLSRFVRVSLPLAWAGIRAGLLLAWLRAFGEFGATVIVAYHPYSLPVFTYVQFGSAGLAATLPAVLWSLAAAFGLLLLGSWRTGHVRLAGHRARPLPAATPPGRLGASERLAIDVRRRLGDFTLAVSHQAASPHVVVLGPSGAGKSLTLRAVAGLDRPGEGTVRVGDRRLDGLPPEMRPIGYMPQEFGLFPHLTVWEHLRFPVGADAGRARFWLARLGLDGLEGRHPGELSGGQRQRVALARALCRDPSLLVLDEPFSSLDAPVKATLRRELRTLQRETGVSTLVVTHDPEEAALLGEELLILHGGRVLQAGATRDVFARPASPLVAEILGFANVRTGRLAAPGRIEADGIVVEAAGTALRPGGTVAWQVAPDQIALDEQGPLVATVLDVVHLGAEREILLGFGSGLRLTARDADGSGLTPGATCRVRIPATAVRVWDSDGAREAERLAAGSRPA